MNFVIVCMDTLRWDYLGCYGNENISTPEIDRFAKRCMRFDRAFCGSFPTIPMRTDAFTGTANWPIHGWKDLDPDIPNIVKLLREAGYYTAFVHDTWNMERNGFGRDFDENIFPRPPEGWEENREKVELPVPIEHIRQDAGGYIRDRAMTWENEYETDWLVAKTGLAGAKWVEENHDRDNWLLWLDTFEIHEDWHPPAFYRDYYSKDYDGADYTYPNYGYTDIYEPKHIERLRACYSGEVSLTDRWFGHVLRQLELCNCLDDTMVIVTSDHGMYLGEHNRMGKHTVDKTDPWPLYDEVARLPWLMYLPGGRSDVTEARIQPADILPTVLDLADVPEGDWPEMDGKSLVPLMEGETDEVHEYIFTSCHSARGPGRIEHVPSLINVHSADWTLCTGPKDMWEPTLYNRRLDPALCENRIDRNRKQAERMQAALIEFMRHKGAKEEYIEEYTPI